MEYSKYVKQIIIFYYIVRLNPCSNGIQKYIYKNREYSHIICLNPCSNGIQKYLLCKWSFGIIYVLILVLMEYKNTVCKSIS